MHASKAELLKKIHGAQTCQIIATGVAIGIFDILSEAPQELGVISKKTSISERLLRRFLNGLIALQLIKKTVTDLYMNTDQGALLRNGAADSLSAIARYKGSRLYWHSLLAMHEGLISNKSPFSIAFGSDLFSYLQQHPLEATTFHEAMNYYTTTASHQLFDVYPFDQLESLLDVGGGSGKTASILQARYPSLSITVFDVPELATHQENPHRPFIGGNFFIAIPKGFKGYLFRNILHDWNDTKVKLILTNLAASMDEQSVAFFLETIIDTTRPSMLGALADITMFVMTDGGFERTAEEFSALFNECGLSIKNILYGPGSKSLLIIEKVTTSEG